MTRRGIAIGAAIILAVGPAAAGRGQVAAAPCAPGVAATPVFTASDVDELGASRLVATHTIEVLADFGAAPVNDASIRFAVAAGATVIRPHGDVNAGPEGVIFVSEAPRSVPVTATWTQDDPTGTTCTASASTTFTLIRSTPTPRLVNVRAVEHLHPHFRWDLLWRFEVNLGRSANLDPVKVMARGVTQARLPGAKVPFRTVTVPLRVGDPKFDGSRQYRLTLPRWTVTTGGDHSAFYVDGDSRVFSMSNLALGYEVRVVQSGRLIARLRLAGRCNSTICDMRIITVQLR